MAYSIDKQFFQRLAKEIVEIVNLGLAPDKPQYQPHNLELGCVLIDYEDGMGYRVVSRALLRNPTEDVYDLVVDVLGSPESALESMLRDVTEKAKKDYDLKLKARNFKAN